MRLDTWVRKNSRRWVVFSLSGWILKQKHGYLNEVTCQYVEFSLVFVLPIRRRSSRVFSVNSLQPRVKGKDNSLSIEDFVYGQGRSVD